MNISAERVDDAMVIRPAETRIDAAVAIAFKDRAAQLIQTPAPRVVLDLAHVTFVDSSGLGAIVAVMKLVPPGCRFELAALTPNVAKVMRLTRLDTVIPILDRAPGGQACGAA